MKIVIAFASVLMMSTTSLSQSTTNTFPSLSKIDDFKKSKKQKTVAWGLLGGGVVLTSTGFAVGMNKFTDDLANIFTLQEPESSGDGEVLFYTGLAAMAGSIPLFIASSKNKRKGEKMSIVFKTEKATCFQHQLFKQIKYPALSVKITL